MKTQNIIFIIALIIVVGFVAYYIGKSGSEEDASNSTTDSKSANEDATINTNTIVDLSQVNSNLSGDELKQAESRDKKRVSDIRSIQSALEEYKSDNDQYPEKITALTTEYLDVIPGNPVPGGITYTYTPIGTAPYLFYDLSYVLEVGIEDITIGDHTATPDGIATP
ncbi:hypothetical protein ACFL0L_04205 [Patescibacteria group bacterium]